jgi:hypothetical protein
MAVTMIVDRKEADLARKASSRLLIYGRRKVGKTFLAKRYLDHDIYVYVKRGGGFYIEGGSVSNMDSYQQFMETLRLWIDTDRRIIIDEFTRLPDEFLDMLQFIGDRGRIIITGSSFHTIRKVISPSSPIMGLYSELRLSLLSPSDIFGSLKKEVDPIKAYSLSPYLRDPWTLQYWRGADTDISDIMDLSRGILRSLIGEVFLEEEKTLTQTYEGIIRGLSLGNWKLSEISDLLFSRRIIDKQDPHLIRPYFNKMEDMDLVRRIPIYRSKEFMYRIRSPIMELGFMMDERFDFFQQSMPRKRLDQEIANRLPGHIEQFTGELMGELLGGTYNYFYSRDFDLDFIITRGKKTLAVGEVKWKDQPSRKEIKLFKERTEYFKCRKIMISRKSVHDQGIISLTPENILEVRE